MEKVRQTNRASERRKRANKTNIFALYGNTLDKSYKRNV
jgi:hypothetical protein